MTLNCIVFVAIMLRLCNHAGLLSGNEPHLDNNYYYSTYLIQYNNIIIIKIMNGLYCDQEWIRERREYDIETSVNLPVKLVQSTPA